jgi:hypothetical protein
VPRRLVTPAIAVVLVCAASSAASAGGPARPDPRAAAAHYIAGGLNAVTVAPHSKAAWALGSRSTRGGSQPPYVVRRTGTRWKSVPIRERAATNFAGVAAASPHSVWVVGTTASGDARSPVVEHSTGGRFSVVNTGLAGGGLDAVAASSPNNVWAAGPPSAFSTNPPLVAHWDGHDWTAVDDHVQKKFAGVSSVSTTGASNAWFLGSSDNFRYDASVWNGHTMRAIDIPASHNAAIVSIATRGPEDTWVVGWTTKPHGSRLLSYTAHWNGTTWKRVHAPSPAYNSQLVSVSIAGSRIYASGDLLNRLQDKAKGYLLRFTHGTWKTVRTPARGVRSWFGAVAVSSKSGAAAGFRSSTTSRGEPTELPWSANLRGHHWKAANVPL